jgi:hypothetical protein
MWKKYIAIAGCAVCLLGASSLIRQHVNIPHPVLKPFSGPYSPVQGHPEGGHEYVFHVSPTVPTIPFCTINVNQPNNAHLVVNIPVALYIEITVPKSYQSCQTKLNIVAPTFDGAPKDATEVILSMSGETSKTIPLLLVPKYAGSQSIIFELPDTSFMRTFDVQTSEYIPDWLKLIFGYSSTAFGPLLTIPYWIDVFRKRKELRIPISPS